eukprot:6475981-Amphidinium_carterae.1
MGHELWIAARRVRCLTQSRRLWTDFYPIETRTVSDDQDRKNVLLNSFVYFVAAIVTTLVLNEMMCRDVQSSASWIDRLLQCHRSRLRTSCAAILHVRSDNALTNMYWLLIDVEFLEPFALSPCTCSDTLPWSSDPTHSISFSCPPWIDSQ